MALIVKKFGGTSLSDLDHIRNAAQRVKEAADKGHQVVVVVSAMAGATDQLLASATEPGFGADPVEVDTVLSAGEQIAAGVFALALQGLGLQARSWMGWQVPILTTDRAGEARISKVETDALKHSLKAGETPVIAGFQGITEKGRITTLGRGGTDISAVAVAAALKAERCDIYTDVPGIYTTDPNFVPKARKLDKITYQETMELASVGAKVMHSRAVALAMRYRVPIQVLTSYEDRPGTMIISEKDIIETKTVTGIACSDNEAKVSILGIRDEPGTVAEIFGPLTEADIVVDMIVQDVSKDSQLTDITFTVEKRYLDKTLELIRKSKKKTGFKDVVSDTEMVKLTVVGLGMTGQAGVAQKMFNALGEKGINIQAISASDIKISILVDRKNQKDALQALHSVYGLDNV